MHYTYTMEGGGGGGLILRQLRRKREERPGIWTEWGKEREVKGSSPLPSPLAFHHIHNKNKHFFSAPPLDPKPRLSRKCSQLFSGKADALHAGIDGGGEENRRIILLLLPFPHLCWRQKTYSLGINSTALPEALGGGRETPRTAEHITHRPMHPHTPFALLKYEGVWLWRMMCMRRCVVHRKEEEIEGWSCIGKSI